MITDQSIEKQWPISHAYEQTKSATGWVDVGPVCVPWYGGFREKNAALEIAHDIQKFAERKVWYGFVTIMGYDVAVVALTEDEAKRLLVAEHARYHSTADGTGPDYAAKSWEDLQEKTEAIVRELPIGKVVWP